MIRRERRKYIELHVGKKENKRKLAHQMLHTNSCEVENNIT